MKVVSPISTSEQVLDNKYVLVITSVYPFTETLGRYGSFVHETIMRLKQRNIQFSVFASAFKGCESHVVEDIPVYRFRYFWKRFEDLTHGEGAPHKVSRKFYLLLATFYILAGTWQLFWLCFKKRPDLLHIHWPFPHGFMALPASKLLKIPMVFTFHGSGLLLSRKFGFVLPTLKWLIPQASAVTVNSSYTHDLVRQVYDGVIAIIPYGITVKTKPTSPFSPNEVPTILYAGRLIERKGVKYLLDAISIILSKQPVQLRIAGNGVQEECLKQACEHLGIEHAVKFLGFVNQDSLPQEYANCDVFVLPSIVDARGDTETLGIVLIEALAHNKPVVACAVGGIVDVVQSNVTGFLVPEKDPKAIAEAVLKLISDPETASQMGRQGHADIQERFGWPRITQLWQNVFAAVLSP